MARDEDKENSKKKEERKEEKKPAGFACRACGTQRPPQGTCPACGAGPVPEHELEATLHETADGWQIVVETYRDGKQQSLPFYMFIQGCLAEKCTSDPQGNFIRKIPFSDHRVEVRFSIIGSRSLQKAPLVIPSRLPPRPKHQPSGGGFMAILKQFAAWKKEARK